jgi:hypothetical protein
MKLPCEAGINVHVCPRFVFETVYLIEIWFFGGGGGVHSESCVTNFIFWYIVVHCHSKFT